MTLTTGIMNRSVCILCLGTLLHLAGGGVAGGQTLTLFGTNNLDIDADSVSGLSYSQDTTSTTVSIAFGGAFGGLFAPSAFDWSNVTVFGLLMSVPAADPRQAFTVDFFNSNILLPEPANFAIARFTGFTTGVGSVPTAIVLTQDRNFIPEGGDGGLDNFSGVAGLQFTWNNPVESGTSTQATLGGLVGLTGPVEPVITSVAYGVNGFTMTWSGTGFLPVIVERRESLEAGHWTAVAQGVATGAYTDTTPPPGKAFYRVVVP